MLTAKVTQLSGGAVHVRFVSSDTTEDTTVDTVAPLMASATPAAEGETTSEVASAPNPIAPETKELAWAAGSFIVLLVLMRFFLFPKLKKGMDARYASVRNDIESADKVKADAQSDVAAYEKALADARAEGAARVDAARQTVDSERNAKLAEVNARIAAARAEADQQTAAARAAARGDIAAAVAKVAARAAEVATGRAPDASVVQAAVSTAMEGAGSR